MAEAPILDECRSLLNELDRVEKRISRLAGEMVDSAGNQDQDELSRIEGLIDSHSEAEEEFAVLRARIVELGRTYHLCPQHAPEEGYSPSGLRGLLLSIQRMEQGFKQPAPEPLESLWEHIPSDLLASLTDPTKETVEQLTEFRTSAERLPSDVERFLDRVISEANHAVSAQAKLSDGKTASLPSTSVPLRQTPAPEKRDSATVPKESIQRIATHPPKVSEIPRSAAPEAKSPPVVAPALPSSPAPLPSAVLQAASAAEEKARQEAAPTDWKTDWKPASMASERDYQDLLEYGEGKLGLGRAEFADLLANLALLNHKQGRFADSEELHRKELMIRENELGQDHPKVATSLNNLALLYRDLGRYEEARALWERSLAIVEKAFGPEHPKVALRLGNLADLLQASGETAQAEQYYQRLLTLRETGSVGNRREAKSSLRKYIGLLRSMRRNREAGEVEAQIITSKPGWFSRWR